MCPPDAPLGGSTKTNRSTTPNRNKVWFWLKRTVGFVVGTKYSKPTTFARRRRAHVPHTHLFHQRHSRRPPLPPLPATSDTPAGLLRHRLPDDTSDGGMFLVDVCVWGVCAASRNGGLLEVRVGPAPKVSCTRRDHFM